MSRQLGTRCPECRTKDAPSVRYCGAWGYEVICPRCGFTSINEKEAWLSPAEALRAFYGEQKVEAVGELIAYLREKKTLFFRDGVKSPELSTIERSATMAILEAFGHDSNILSKLIERGPWYVLRLLEQQETTND